MLARLVVPGYFFVQMTEPVHDGRGSRLSAFFCGE
jgi:hypothetical protein